MYLTTCYNPEKAEVFPKQSTIAAKTGISERSVTRAVQELFKAGLILIECKHTNRYKIVAKNAFCRAQDEKFFDSDNLSENLSQNGIQKTDNLSDAHVHEQIREQKKEPVRAADFKILKGYAIKQGAKNVNAYINALKKNGSASQIIKKFKEKEAADRYAEHQILKTIEGNRELNSIVPDDPKDCGRLQDIVRALRQK